MVVHRPSPLGKRGFSAGFFFSFAQHGAFFSALLKDLLKALSFIPDKDVSPSSEV